MLKKAGIVVLGAAAGMISLAPLASAGEAPQHGGDSWGEHHEASGPCYDSGNTGSAVNVSDIANCPVVGPVNVGGTQNNPGGGEGRTGGGGGGGAQQGNQPAINVSDILQNPVVNPINALGTQNN